MSEAKKYAGSCHCGKVAFTIEAAIDEVISCNCSICSRTGALLTFVPKEKFTLVSGQGAMTDYTFNKHVVHHEFCSTCGVRAFGHGARPGGGEIYAINVRCLADVDPASFPVKHVDGKRL